MEVPQRKQRLRSFLQSLSNHKTGIRDKVENRIDQRMPPEPDHRLLSPFQEKRPAITGLKKLCLLPRPKTTRQRAGQRSAQWSGKRSPALKHGRAADFIFTHQGHAHQACLFIWENWMEIKLEFYNCSNRGQRYSCATDIQPRPAHPV